MQNRVLDPKIRSKVIAVAADEFADNGFDGSSLNKILQRSGLSKGRFYYYFADKMALFLAVMVEHTKEIYENDDSFLVDDVDYWQIISGLNSQMVAYYRRNPNWFRLPVVFWQAYSAHQDRPALKSFMMQELQFFRYLATKSIQSGKLREDLSEDFLIYCANEVRQFLANWFLHQKDTFGEQDLRDFLDTMTDFLRRLLLPKGSVV